jgi:hypothetical protein
MGEVTIVGAGLAGLTAAVNLARRGYAVKVLEREDRIGGSALYHPSGQGSPLLLDDLCRYVGIDISPALEPIREMREVAGGKIMEINPALIKAYFFERGPRETSLDSYLYRIALEEGVEFRFGRPVLSREDVAELPPGAIVATGLHFEGFQALDVPYLVSHHFTYKGTCDPELNYVNMYHDVFTGDYGYTSAFRGIRYAHLFNRRRPLSFRDRDRFASLIEEVEGWEVPAWNSFTFPVPAASIRNPRLFASDKILAGTLAGAMDPVAFFGLHGALVSGKIAATAVEDKERAWREFRRCTAMFPAAYLLARMKELYPRRLMVLGFRAAFRNFERKRLVHRVMLAGMPGFRCVHRGRPLPSADELSAH